MTISEPEPGCGAPTQTLMDPTMALELSTVAKALSDPVRVRIYAHITSSGNDTVCACHLLGQLGISQPTLSHHLKKLVDVGLITREYRGRWAHYSPRPEAVESLQMFLGSTSPAPIKAR